MLTGASASEQLLEAARRDNVELLQEVLGAASDAAALVNATRDVVGNLVLHVAAAAGLHEVLDVLLDVEGVEVDPVNRLEGNTPLMAAVEYAQGEPEHGLYVVEMLLEVGASVRVKNKAGRTAVDLAARGSDALKDALEQAEYGVVPGAPAGGAEEEAEEEGDGPASDLE